MTSFRNLPKNIKIAFSVLLFLAVVSTASAAYLWNKSESSVRAQTTEDEVEKIVADVKKVLILPENETPTLATVTDLTQLRDQPFFAKAEIGDNVLIYAESKKAVLWRPSTKMVVEISTLNTAPASQSNEAEI